MLTVIWVYIVFNAYYWDGHAVYALTANLIPIVSALLFMQYQCSSILNIPIILISVFTLAVATLFRIKVAWVGVVCLLYLSIFCFDAIYIAFTCGLILPFEISWLLTK